MESICGNHNSRSEEYLFPWTPLHLCFVCVLCRFAFAYISHHSGETFFMLMRRDGLVQVQCKWIRITYPQLYLHICTHKGSANEYALWIPSFTCTYLSTRAVQMKTHCGFLALLMHVCTRKGSVVQRFVYLHYNHWDIVSNRLWDIVSNRLFPCTWLKGINPDLGTSAHLFGPYL